MMMRTRMVSELESLEFSHLEIGLNDLCVSSNTHDRSECWRALPASRRVAMRRRWRGEAGDHDSSTCWSTCHSRGLGIVRQA